MSNKIIQGRGSASSSEGILPLTAEFAIHLQLILNYTSTVFFEIVNGIINLPKVEPAEKD